MHYKCVKYIDGSHTNIDDKKKKKVYVAEAAEEESAEICVKMGSYIDLCRFLALMQEFRRKFDVLPAVIKIELHGHKGNNRVVFKI